ncbi:hypothetical protein [Treponema pallidum]|uniref:Uncharacterized protein TP_0432 n=4 Tax=Treponema pallidum subsp. pallidum TaxID=161 RepID=Y432_TREPA|nr:RecName: Full=Uncharacterized protein TP_0432 [Treponema pallidum subsp. pallidum str. Nichols]ACD70858.1 hypothetical protein TPASS_0432 [Treponema pallidum subsp. pallidum SS14]ADR64313.1 hypothetical protein [Treponema pallidum subsp. pallidum]ADR64373.1 hypothetical protein [Treponema pallidum subsp. pallidum str. Mexico A]AEZ60756.1 hypothetical protein TPADAL_0432 [Treponema pallidum subsp. pallidum DAL-1]QFP69321.1 hypothetical protein FA889_02220 [Treponema pallidum]
MSGGVGVGKRLCCIALVMRAFWYLSAKGVSIAYVPVHRSGGSQDSSMSTAVGDTLLNAFFDEGMVVTAVPPGVHDGQTIAEIAACFEVMPDYALLVQFHSARLPGGESPTSRARGAWSSERFRAVWTLVDLHTQRACVYACVAPYRESIPVSECVDVVTRCIAEQAISYIRVGTSTDTAGVQL